jgi:hypothetical protein
MLSNGMNWIGRKYEKSVMKGLPPSGIDFRYSWVDLAEIFREYVCCINLISCKFLINEIFS